MHNTYVDTIYSSCLILQLSLRNLSLLKIQKFLKRVNQVFETHRKIRQKVECLFKFNS